jgi:hypothetical protein
MHPEVGQRQFKLGKWVRFPAPESTHTGPSWAAVGRILPDFVPRPCCVPTLGDRGFLIRKFFDCRVRYVRCIALWE